MLDPRWELALDPAVVTAAITRLPRPSDGAHFGLHVLDGRGSAAVIGRSLEATVFATYYGNTPQVLAEEYGPYEDHSKFIVMIDHEHHEVVGVARFVLPSDMGLKSLNDLAHPDSPWHQDAVDAEDWLRQLSLPSHGTADLATIAVAPGHGSHGRAPGAFACLCSAGVRWSRVNGITHWVCIIDTIALDLIQAWGRPLNTIPGTSMKPYLGSEASAPAYVDLEGVLQRLRQAGDPLYLVFETGRGLPARLVSNTPPVLGPTPDRP